MAILNTNDLPTTFNTVLKDGTYAFLVEKFEEKKDRSDNVYMHLELKLISDDVKLKIFDRFYISHVSSPQAVNVGKARLRSFLEACGFSGPFDTENDAPNFVNTEVMADTKVGKDMNGDARTEIKKFHPRAPAAQAVQKASSQAQPQSKVVEAAKPFDLNSIPF